MRLAGKVALVTGGGRSIGKGIALAFGREGADVAVNYVEHGCAAEEVAAKIRGMGRRSFAVQADVADRGQVERMFTAVIERLGGIDVLVSNAGICPFHTFMEVTPEIWQRTLDVNLSGAFHCGQVAAREMIRQGRGGKIIFIGSISQVIAAPLQVHYCATKAGIGMLAKGMAHALGTYKINVNVLAPGAIETDMTQWGYDTVYQDPEKTREFNATIPWGRAGLPADCAGPAVFLASDESEYVTGTTLYVDGGYIVSKQPS